MPMLFLDVVSYLGPALKIISRTKQGLRFISYEQTVRLPDFHGVEPLSQSVLFGRLNANSFNFWKVGPRSSSNKSLRFKVVRIIESVKNDELMKMSSSFK